MSLPPPPFPPWLTQAVPLGALLVTTAVGWGSLSADLRHEQAARATVERKVEALEGRAAVTDSTLSGMSVQLAGIKDTLLDIRDALKAERTRR